MGDVELGLLSAKGSGVGMYLRKALLERLGWKQGDRLALRVAGEKLIVERLDMQSLAIIRTGTPQARPGKAE